MPAIQVTFNVKLPALVKHEDDQFISFCPILDVWSQGESKQRALENLQEALRLFFISCFERGTLQQVLKDCGFTPIQATTAPEPFPSDYEAIDLPLPFMIPPKADDPPEWRD